MAVGRENHLGQLTAVVFVKRSVRFPGKHSALVQGTPMIDVVISRLRKATCLSDVIVYSKDPDVWPACCNVHMDTTTGTIADSLLSALQIYGDIFAVGGDMPCLSGSIIDAMAKLFDGTSVIPILENGWIEPLHAFYASDTAPMLKRSIDDGKFSLREYIDHIPHRFFRVSGQDVKHFLNVNNPQDLSTIPEDCRI
jgi:molybdopterin-guanine dinucleotide biosynthesis protein A